MKVNRYIDGAHREDPKTDGCYLCITLRLNRGFSVLLEKMNYTKREGFITTGGYYFDDDYGVDLIWSDIDINSDEVQKILNGKERVAIIDSCFDPHYLCNLQNIELKTN